MEDTNKEILKAVVILMDNGRRSFTQAAEADRTPYKKHQQAVPWIIVSRHGEEKESVSRL